MADVIDKVSLAASEQETVINIERDSEMAQIYSSDTVWIRRLKRLLAVKNTAITVLNEDKFGILVELPKSLITVRAKKTERNLTDEQKQAAAERLRKARETGA